MPRRNASRDFYHGLLALATILAVVSYARASADWGMISAQFQSQSVRVDSIDSQGVHFENADSSPAVSNWEQILELARPNPKHSVATTQPGQRLLHLYLNGGDHCMGQPISLADDKLTWNDIALGSLSFSVEQLAAISVTELSPASLSETRSDDVVRLANGDVAHGIISQIDAHGVGLQTGGGATTLPWDSIAAVMVSTPPASSKNPRLFRVSLANGTILSVADLSLNDASCTLVLADKSKHSADPATINRIEQINGPVSWVTSRRPVENIYKSFFSESFPARFDATVDTGLPIWEKFPGFHHGIGCHSYSRISYDLSGGYAGFRTQYAIDSDSPLADVTVRILLDGKTIFEKTNVKAGTISPVVTIPISQSKLLTLEVDYGENYATEDRFVWLDPALIRDISTAAQP